jgi:ribonuclease HI
VRVTTNNAAEYRALILGLDYTAKKGFKHIRAQGNSKLVCKQVSCSFFAICV